MENTIENATNTASEKTEKPNDQVFSSEMTVNDALAAHPEAGLVLAGYHLGGCSHCSINQVETLGQVANAYGIPLDALLSSLNDLIEND